MIRFPRPAFTLIEVLVVTAIVALLISILMPAMNQARQQARSTVCMAYIRQLGMGMSMYLDQYGAYPGHQWILEKDGQEVRIRWFNAMTRLLHGVGVQGCPSVPEWEVARNNSYGYNYKYLGSGRRNDASPTAPWERFPVKSLKAPSDTIAFGDTDGTGWKTPYYGTDVEDPDMFGHHGYTLDPTYVPTFSLHTEKEIYAYHNWRTYISTRHLGGSNLCFADGHVSTLHPKQVYRSNRLWNGLGSEDPIRDPHLPDRYATDDPNVEWRFPDA